MRRDMHTWRRPNIYDSAEDKLFARFVHEVGGLVAPGPVALSFAVESWPYSIKDSIAPWGVHNVWPYQGNWREAILPNCSGLDALLHLKPKVPA